MGGVKMFRKIKEFIKEWNKPLEPFKMPTEPIKTFSEFCMSYENEEKNYGANIGINMKYETFRTVYDIKEYDKTLEQVKEYGVRVDASEDKYFKNICFKDSTGSTFVYMFEKEIKGNCKFFIKL